MNDKYEKQMKKGVLDMLVLKLLWSEAKYGYQIIQELREKSDDAFLLKDGCIRCFIGWRTTVWWQEVGAKPKAGRRRESIIRSPEKAGRPLRRSRQSGTGLPTESQR